MTQGLRQAIGRSWALLPAVHPGVALLVWLVAVVQIQMLTGGWLAGGVGAIAGLAAMACPGEVFRLMGRIRYFLALILILFAWMTPGDALLASWPAWSPTREGAAMAMVHGLRLVGVVALVALLLGLGGRDFVVSGLYAVLLPLEPLGLPRERLAVRLLLVLRYVEESPVGNWRDWLAPWVPDEGVVLHVQRCPLGWIDGVLLLMAGGVLAGGMV